MIGSEALEFLIQSTVLEHLRRLTMTAHSLGLIAIDAQRVTLSAQRLPVQGLCVADLVTLITPFERVLVA